MKKFLLFVFAAVAAVCLSVSIASMNNSNVVHAEVITGTTPSLSATKYLKSTDGKTLLLATGINGFGDCYELGYITTGADAVVYNTAKYYTSISLTGGAKTWTAVELFPGYVGMIVWEIRSTAYASSFKAYARVGDREDSVLVESDKIVYGIEKEVVTHATAIEINASYIHSTDFSMENFAASGKAVTFEYKAKDDANNSGNNLAFTIWTISWSPRITELIEIDIVNDTVGGGIGKIEDIGDGWRRVTINCSDMPLYGDAMGNETAGLMYFNTVNHAFLFDNVGFTDEDVHIGATAFIANTAKDYYFGATPSTSGVTLDKIIVIDVKFASVGNFGFYLNEYYYGRWCGPFTLTSEGVLTGTGAVSCEDVGDDWYRMKINLASTNKSDTLPAFVSRVNILNTTTANGFVKYIGYEDPDIHDNATAFVAGAAKDYYFGENPSTSGVTLDKTVVIDVKFTSVGNFGFYLNEYYYGRWCGPFTLTSEGVFTGSGAVSCEDVGNGWYRMKIDLASTNKSDTLPAFVSRVNILSTSTGSGYVMYMGEED